MTKLNFCNALLICAYLSSMSINALGGEYHLVVEKKLTVKTSKQMKQSFDSEGDQKVIITASNEAEAMKIATESGLYSKVEPDYVVSSVLPKKVESQPAQNREVMVKGQSLIKGQPNDPEFQYQWFWRAPMVEHAFNLMGANNIIGAFSNSNQLYATRVAVIDSSFGLNSDLNYSEGYEFATVFNRTRGPSFITPENLLADEGFGHGLGIAAIIGAEANNGLGTAGIAKTQIVALKSLHANMGYMSDVADSIKWASGESFPGIPDISAPVDVINMSLSAVGTCPFYMQDAINLAVNKGIVVLVATGNDGVDVSNRSPANCDNVIAVGANTTSGHKADFSNYGSNVDVVAMGLSVYAPNAATSYSWWEGTSQAVAIASGAAAMAKSEFKWVSPAEIESVMKLTARAPSTSPATPENNCDGGRCGAGILDVNLFMDEMRSYMNNEDSFIKSVVNGECESSIEAQLSPTLKLCEMYELNIQGSDTAEYVVYEVPADKSFTLANATEVASFQGSNIVSGYYQFKEGVQYGYIKCENNTCGSDLVRMSTKNIAKPEWCK